MVICYSILNGLRHHCTSLVAQSKESVCNAEGPDSVPGLGIIPGEGNGNPFQYSCLENPMDRGAWWGRAHEVGLQELDMT